MLSINEIKKAIDNGHKVVSKGGSYEVIKDNLNQYLIKCHFNGHCIGLHGQEDTKFEHVPNYMESDGYHIIEATAAKKALISETPLPEVICQILTRFDLSDDVTDEEYKNYSFAFDTLLSEIYPD